MRITNLNVEGYGVWSGLRVERLSEAINVFYGPNEAGKTTLLQFIRSMLYGFSPERRRYLPPVHGGRPGGAINVVGPNGRFQIARYDAAPDGAEGEQLTLTAPDGTRQGEHFVKVLLSNVDEAVFNNVFAIGLREIQELATLGDTEAAEMLYSLSVGLDRVSLVEVLRELAASRNRVLDAAGGQCHVLQLLAEREKLRAEIEELGEINHRFGRLIAQRDQIQGDGTRLEEEANRTQRLLQLTDLALAVRRRWADRAAMDEQLAAFGPPQIMPDRAMERLDSLNADIRKHQQHVERFGRQREELKREFAALEVNDALWRQTARIEALKEQEPWIAQLQGQIDDLDRETNQLSAELAAERQRLGLTPSCGAGVSPAAENSRRDACTTRELDACVANNSPPAISSKKLLAIRSPAKLLRQNRERLETAKQAAAVAGENAESLSRQIEAALASRGASDLAAAMDRAGNLVSQFRRRLQIDGRLDQLARRQTELEEQAAGLFDRQVLPLGAIVGIGAVFVVGVMLIFTGLLMPATIIGTIGWAISLLGFAGGGAAVGVKLMLERSNARRLDGCQQQLDVLHSQLEQTKADRDALDAQLPSGGGPIAGRLQTAERELAALEELAPLEGRRNAARQEADAASRRAADAEEQHKAARRRWRETLAAAGLPEGISTQQAKRLIQRADWLSATQLRLAGRREELARRRRELDSLAARIVQLAAEAGVNVGGKEGSGVGGQGSEFRGQGAEQDEGGKCSVIELLHGLSKAAERQKEAVARREAIRREARRLRAAASKRDEAIGRLQHRRRQLLIEAGVQDEQEFRRRAVECEAAAALRQKRDVISREIEAILASQCAEDAIRQQLEGGSAATLEGRRGELGGRLAAVQGRLHALLENRGRLNEQIAAIVADSRLASKRLDLAVLEKRLADAVRRWQVLAAACRILDVIRDTYQRDRQPETLQEASGYLDRLTQGRYRRVWTPLGEHALRVDDAEGRQLPVEALSRGTREQLFLSLRLALASSYARRGAPLPLVLDDVLVNFDDERHRPPPPCCAISPPPAIRC